MLRFLLGKCDREQQPLSHFRPIGDSALWNGLIGYGTTGAVLGNGACFVEGLVLGGHLRGRICFIPDGVGLRRFFRGRRWRALGRFEGLGFCWNNGLTGDSGEWCG